MTDKTKNKSYLGIKPRAIFLEHRIIALLEAMILDMQNYEPSFIRIQENLNELQIRLEERTTL